MASRAESAPAVGIGEPRWLRGLLITLALASVSLLVLLPLAVVAVEASSAGGRAFLAAIADPDTLSAIRLTLLVALLSVPANMVFGLSAAWAITRFHFRGKQLLLTLIDLPFSVSPVVAGLVFVLLFGAQGWFGPGLRAHGIHVIFATPGLVLARPLSPFPMSPAS